MDNSSLGLASVQRIWSSSAHCAFTDLVKWKGGLFCAFREATNHHSRDGAIRVLFSRDGSSWSESALLKEFGSDLRDPKFATCFGRNLTMTCMAVRPREGGAEVQTVAYCSEDGRSWAGPMPIGERNMWLWRVTPSPSGDALSVGYSTTEPWHVSLYAAKGLEKFEPLVPRMFSEGRPTEHALAFDGDGTCYCLLRRDAGTATAQLGIASKPYLDWHWKDLGVRIGGPCLVRLESGELITIVRLHDRQIRTGVCLLDPKNGRLSELLGLPSGGDTSYAGAVLEGRTILVSYYSSHEGNSAIYFANIFF